MTQLQDGDRFPSLTAPSVHHGQRVHRRVALC
jgi:hypothetical protein